MDRVIPTNVYTPQTLFEGGIIRICSLKVGKTFCFKFLPRLNRTSVWFNSVCPKLEIKIPGFTLNISIGRVSGNTVGFF
jgi:hypothetical protein